MTQTQRIPLSQILTPSGAIADRRTSKHGINNGPCRPANRIATEGNGRLWKPYVTQVRIPPSPPRDIPQRSLRDHWSRLFPSDYRRLAGRLGLGRPCPSNESEGPKRGIGGRKNEVYRGGRKAHRCEGPRSEAAGQILQACRCQALACARRP